VLVVFVQIVVDRFGTYRTMVNYLSLWLHMEIKLFSYDLSSRACFAVALR